MYIYMTRIYINYDTPKKTYKNILQSLEYNISNNLNLITKSKKKLNLIGGGLNDDMNLLNQNIENLEQANRELGSEVVRISQNFNKLKDANLANQELEEENQDLKNQNSRLTSTINDTKATHKKELENIKTILAEKEKENVGLQELLEQRKFDLSKIEKTKLDAEKELSDAKKRLDQQDIELEQILADNKAEGQKEIVMLRNQINENQNEILEKTKKIQELEIILEEIKTALSEADKISKLKETELLNLNNRIEDLQRENEKVKADNKTLESSAKEQLTIAAQRINGLTKDLEGYKELLKKQVN